MKPDAIEWLLFIAFFAVVSVFIIIGILVAFGTSIAAIVLSIAAALFVLLRMVF